MKLPEQDKCKFCADYEKARLSALKNKRTATAFWCALRVKAYPWKKKSVGAPLYTMTLGEYHIHFCPNCGKQLTVCRQD